MARELFFPAQFETSERAGAFAYWAPRRRVAVRVGAAGRAILEICRETSSVGTIVDRASRKLGLDVGGDNRVIETFLDRMVKLGLLAEDATPDPERVPQPPSRYRPVVMYLHMSVQCNLSCSYCYNVEHRSAEQFSKPLSRLEYLGILEQAAGRGVKQINLTGGEPMLSRDWAIVAERAKSLGMTVGLVTNGTAINARNAELVARFVDKTIISIDSAIAEEHDAQRGAGSHAMALRGVDALRQVGYAGLALRPVITRHNLESLPLYPRFAQDRCGTTDILIAPYAPNSEQEERDLRLLATPADLRAATARFEAQLQQLRPKSKPASDDVFAKESARCGAGSGIVSVDFNGDVYPCQAIHDPATKMGNLREQDLFEMGETPASRMFRESDYSAIDVCKSCNFNELCGGGCRAVAFKVFRSIAAHNPVVCENNKAQAWDKIWAGLSPNAGRGAFEADALALAPDGCSSCST